MNLPKDLRSLRKLAERQGWRIKPTARGHQLWLSPSGEVVPVQSDNHRTADPRAVMNLRAYLKRAGLRAT